jgi:phosphoglycolate phosphatase
MNFDGLIFDLDGTLWDCTAATTDSCNRGYEHFGINKRVTQDFIKSITGKPTTECVDILLEGVADSIKIQASKCFDELEVAEIKQQARTSLYQGVSEGLRELQKHYSLYLVSNCSVDYLELFQQNSGVAELFLDFECFGRTQEIKSENIKSLVKRQNLKSACYIGDTAGDEEAALTAEVHFFHAAYGFGKPKGNHVAFDNFDQLTRYFLELKML